MGTEPNATSERVLREIEILREMMLRVHYHEESHWLTAAVAFPHLCQAPIGQEALRRTATIAWQLGFPAVSQWLNAEVLSHFVPHEDTPDSTAVPLPLTTAQDLA